MTSGSACLSRNEHIVLLSLPKKQVLCEQEVCSSHSAIGFSDALVVHVDAASLDILPRLTFARTELGVNEQLHQRHPGAIEARTRNRGRGHFARDLGESRLTDSV